jgi:hypothetical protein
MANEKKVKLKTKVRTPKKTPSVIDSSLNDMISLYQSNPVTGKMDLLIKKKGGEITVNEYSISETLNEKYKELGAIIKESAMAELASLEEGKVRVVFEAEYEFIEN